MPLTKKTNFHEKFAIFFIFFILNVFNHLLKRIPIYSPKTTIPNGFNRSWSWSIIKQGQFTKSFSFLKSFFYFLVNYNLAFPSFNQEVGTGHIILFENKLIIWNNTVKHLINHDLPKIITKLFTYHLHWANSKESVI